MTTLNIIDTNNWLRIKSETSINNFSVSNLWTETLVNSQAYKTQIFVFDGKDSRKKRRELYPDYKAKRKPADQSFYDGLNFFRELLEYAPNNVHYISVPEYEADDIIGTLASSWCYLYDKINIISTDKDLTQLKRIPNVDTLAKEPVEPKWVRLYKTFVGDSSDNIPGVKGFGQSAWINRSDDWKDRMTALFGTGQFDKEVVERICRKDNIGENLIAKIMDTDIQLWWRIVGLIEVPSELIAKNLKTGKNGESIAWKMLQEFN